MGSCCCNFCNFILISDVHWVSNLSFNITCPSEDTRSRLMNFWRASFSLSKKVMGFSLDHRESKRVSEKHLFLLYWLPKAFDCVDHSKLWKILQEIGIPDHLPSLLRNLYVGQEATARTGHGMTDWFQIGKGIPQGCILSPWLFNLYADYLMRSAGLDEAQAGVKIARRNISNLRYTADITLMEESKEELKNLLKWKRRVSSWLKLYIEKTQIVASGPNTSWQMGRETMWTVRDFIFLGSKITADGDCSHEIKKLLLLGKKKKSYDQLRILKSRGIILPIKVHVVKAMVFPVVMYGCESWTIKKTEHQKIDPFELWCWRLLRVPWTVRRSTQLILKEIGPGYSLDGLMLKLKLQ